MTESERQQNGNGLVAPKYTVHTLHTELNRRFERTNVCISCGNSPTQYALIHGREYSLNRYDYIELCTTCHGYYDNHNPACSIECSCIRKGRYMHGRGYQEIVREDLPLRECAYNGCKMQFYPRRTMQIYHSKTCVGAAYREKHGIKKSLRSTVCQREGCKNLIPVDAKATAKYCSNSCKQLAYRERKLSGAA